MASLPAWVIGSSNPLTGDGRHFLVRNGPLVLMACAGLLAAYVAIYILRRKSHWLFSLPLATGIASGGLMALGIGTIIWHDISEAFDQQVARETAAEQMLAGFGTMLDHMMAADLGKLKMLQAWSPDHLLEKHSDFGDPTEGVFMAPSTLTVVAWIDHADTMPMVCQASGPWSGRLADALVTHPEIRETIRQLALGPPKPTVFGPLVWSDPRDSEQPEDAYLLGMPVAPRGRAGGMVLVGVCPVSRLVSRIVERARSQPIAYEICDARGQVLRQSARALPERILQRRYELGGTKLEVRLAILQPTRWPSTRVVCWVGGVLASILTGMLLARVLVQTQRLRDQNSWLGDLSQACIANVQDAFIVIDPEMRVVEWNMAAERLTGIPQRLALGRSLGEVFPAAQRHGLLKYCRWALDHGQPIHREDFSYVGDEIRGRYSLHGFPVHENLVLQVRDLTAEREAQRRREQVNRLQAERATTLRLQQDKVRFVRALRHDILNMLNALSVSVYMLRRQQAAGADPAVLDQLEQIILRIVDMTENLSEMVRLESGTVDLSISAVKLGELLGSLADQLRGLTERQGLQLEVLCENLDETEVIETDLSRLQRVLFNIAQNAIKFTVIGSVKVIARACGDDRGQVEFEITDTGPGIASGDLPKIFEPFFRGTSSTAGNGLGLTIVRHLIGVLGGRLSVRSACGRGTTFLVRIPWVLSRDPAVSAEEFESLRFWYPA